MRRSILLSLLLALCLVLCLPAPPVSAAAGGLCQIESLELLADGTGSKAAVRVSAPEDCLLAVAVYESAGGRMTGFWTLELSGSPEPAAAELPLSGYGRTGGAAQAFLLEKGSLAPLCLPHLLVLKGGTTVRGRSFGGMTVAESVGDGDVTLDNVSVTGSLSVEGGGVNSVVITNGSNVGSVSVRKTAAGGVRLRAEEGARVGVVTVDDGKDDIILEGEFNQISVATDAPVLLRGVQASGLTLRAEKAKVSLAAGGEAETRVSAVLLTAEAKDAALTVEQGASVASLTSQAEGSSVGGGGSVTLASVSGNNSRIDTAGTLLTVAPGTEGVTQNNSPAAAPAPSEPHGGEGTDTVTLAADYSSATVRLSDGRTETVSLTPLRSPAELAALWRGAGEDAAIQSDVILLPGFAGSLSEAARDLADENPEQRYPALRFGEGHYLIVAPGAAVTADCALELRNCAVFNLGSLDVTEEGNLLLFGGAEVAVPALLVNDGLLSVSGSASFAGEGVSVRNNGALLNLQYCGFHEGASLVNGGTILNGSPERRDGGLEFFGTRLFNRAGGAILNNSYMELASPGGSLDNEGVFCNGPTAGVGENDMVFAYLRLNGIALENRGEITNNGDSDWFGVTYTQTAEAVFETYGSRGLNLTACSVTVPAGARFHDQGYLTVNDQYDVEPDSDCPDHCSDLSGWADFRKIWQDPNGSRWADYRAQVFSAAGYERAAAVQRNEHIYTRMDFLSDLTLKDTALEDFREYWVLPRGFGDGDGEYGGTTLTLAGKVTVANGATLHAEGMEWWTDGQNQTLCGGIALAEGAELTVAPGWDRDTENGWEHRDSGQVFIWASGSYSGGSGRVLLPCDLDAGEFPGEFNIFYEDFYDYDPETDGNAYRGTLERRGSLANPPVNAVYVADVRLIGDLEQAVKEEKFRRVWVRGNSNLSISGSLTLPERFKQLYIEPGSGLLVEEGAVLTVEADNVDNNGDISVYGALYLSERSWMQNHQYLEIGSVSGSRRGRMEIAGGFANWGAIHIYPLGDLVLTETGRLDRGLGDITVDAGGRVDTGNRHYSETFTEALTVTEEAEFENCVFEKPVTVVEASGKEYTVDFHDSCTFAPEAVITLRPAGDSAGDWRESFVRLCGMQGADIILNASGEAMSGEGSFTVNGIRAELRDGVFGSCSLRLENREEGGRRQIFQADASGGGELGLIGSLPADYDELRLMQGSIDLSGLSTDPAVSIHISDMWGATRVNIGSHAVELTEDAQDQGGGFDLIAEEGASFTVSNARMDWDEQERFYGYSTGVRVTLGEREYYLDPHIFGARNGHPAVYIGTDDGAVEYELSVGGNSLPFEKECPVGDEAKTHLNPTEGGDWFDASPDLDPGLVLTLRLPGGVTGTFDPVPVKPDWKEAEEA